MRTRSLVHDHPALAASLSREGGVYEVATSKPLNGRPNWTMEWATDDQSARAAFDRMVRSVQTQIALGAVSRFGPFKPRPQHRAL